MYYTIEQLLEQNKITKFYNVILYFYSIKLL